MQAFGHFRHVTPVFRTAMVELCTAIDRAGRPVTLVVLTPAAGRDPHWSAEFADLVVKDGTAKSPQDSPIHDSDLYGSRPWAAGYPRPGRRGVERLLARLPGVLPEGTDPASLLPPPRPPQRPYPGPSAPQPAGQWRGQPGTPGRLDATGTHSLPVLRGPVPGTPIPVTAPPGQPDERHSHRTVLVVALIGSIIGLLIILGFALFFAMVIS